MAVVCMNSFVTNEFGAKQDLADRHDLTRTRVSKAATVHDYAPDLVEAVLTKTKSLDEAYAEAKQRKEEQASRAPLTITRRYGRYRKPASHAGCTP